MAQKGSNGGHPERLLEPRDVSFGFAEMVREGLLQVSQRPLIELQDKLGEPEP